MKNDDRRDALALLSAASNSAYLKFLARDAGLTEKRASFVVTALARELDPEFASALAADDENSAASRLASRDAGALAALRSPAARSEPAATGRATPSPAAPSREAAKYPRVILNSDGAARGNPGPAGAGAYVSTPDGEAVAVVKKYLGEATNNVAEYSALILGLEAAAKAGAGEVEVRADSELMIRQLTGVYKVKHPDMKQLYEIVRARERSFRRVTYRHVPREQNVIADRLSNEAIDERA